MKDFYKRNPSFWVHIIDVKNWHFTTVIHITSTEESMSSEGNTDVLNYKLLANCHIFMSLHSTYIRARSEVWWKCVVKHRWDVICDSVFEFYNMLYQALCRACTHECTYDSSRLKLMKKNSHTFHFTHCKKCFSYLDFLSCFQPKYLKILKSRKLKLLSFQKKQKLT